MYHGSPHEEWKAAVAALRIHPDKAKKNSFPLGPTRSPTRSPTRPRRTVPHRTRSSHGPSAPSVAVPPQRTASYGGGGGVIPAAPPLAPDWQQPKQQQQHHNEIPRSIQVVLRSRPEKPKNDNSNDNHVHVKEERVEYDPRWQICNFFGQLGQSSAAEVFTIWRPTSSIAIQRMMERQATGKGLEIKGKSSKTGTLSGYVPYLQIHQEPHKARCKTLRRTGRTRIFYETLQQRDAVLHQLEPLQKELLNTIQDAKRAVLKTTLSGFSMAQDSVVTGKGERLPQWTNHTKVKLCDELQTLVQQQKQQKGTQTTTSASAHTTMSLQSMQPALPDLSAVLGKRGSTNQAATSGISLRLEQQLSLLRGGGSTRTNSRSNPLAAAATKVTSRDTAHAAAALKQSDKQREEKREWALQQLFYDMDDPSIHTVDDYAPHCFGMELPDRLLWKVCVLDQDIGRPAGSEYETGRPSEPAFQDMNFIAIEKTRHNKVQMTAPDTDTNTATADNNKDLGFFSSKFMLQEANPNAAPTDDPPRVVLWQTNLGDNPMDARGLIMAYEENGRVLPVVSDFDCFTLGSKGLSYQTPLPADQVELLNWSVSQMESVLADNAALQPEQRRSWTSCWLDVLKTSASKGFHPEMPRYGFGDPKSYAMMERAVANLRENGSVRHGAECFNYYFPQELDQEFLIVSDRLPGKWKYVNASELQSFLHDRIDEGFTFPLNPKWVLCDQGWKALYDHLVASQKPHVQESLKVWFPEQVRNRMEAIHAQYTNGFLCEKGDDDDACGTEAMDGAVLALDNYLNLRRATVKLRAVVRFNYLLMKVRKRRHARKALNNTL